MLVYYLITAIISLMIGFGGGYFVFKPSQADFSVVLKICKDDRICAQYTACLIVNSRESGGQNPRNCDLLVEAITYEVKQTVLQKTYEYCAKQDYKEAAICREYLRPK